MQRKQMPLLRLALRYIKRRRNASLLLVLTLGIMTTLLAALFTSSGYLTQQYKNLFIAATSPVDLVITNRNSGFFNQTALIEAIKGIQGIDKISARIQVDQRFKLENGTMFQATLVGLERNFDLELGSYPSFKRVEFSYNRVFLSQDLGNRLYSEGRYNSTKLILIDASGRDHNVTVTGFVYPQLLQLWIRNSIFVELSDAQKIVGADGQANVILVKLKDFLTSTEMIPLINQRLGPDFQVRNMKAGISDLVKSDQETLVSAVEVPIIFSLFFSAAFFIISLFMTVRDRQGELVVLQVLGATGKQLVLLFAYQAIIISLLGVITGLVLGGVLPGLILLVSGSGSSPALLGFFQEASNVTSIAIATFIGLISTASGLLLPIVAMRWQVRAGIRTRLSRIPRMVYSLAALGLLLLVVLHPYPKNDLVILLDTAALVSAIFVLLLYSLRGARRLTGAMFTPLRGLAELISLGLKRSFRYHFATLSILTLAASFVILSGGIETSLSQATFTIVERHFGADVVAKPNDPTPANYTEQLLRIGGVSAATPIYVAQSQIGNNPIALIAIDPKTFPTVVTLFFEGGLGETPFTRMLSEPSSVLIARPLLNAISETYSHELTINSSFLLPIGSTAANLTVGAVISSGFFHWLALDGIPLTMGIFISYDTLLHFLPPARITDEVSLFLLKAETGADPQSLALKLKGISGYPLEVFTTKDIEIGAADAFNSLFLGLRLLTYLSGALATLSLVSIAAINVIERRFDLGLFRALGMTKSQSLFLFIGEFILTIMLGCALGAFSGEVVLSEVISLSSQHVPISVSLSVSSLTSSILIILLPPLIGGVAAIIAFSTTSPYGSLKAKPIQL